MVHSLKLTWPMKMDGLEVTFLLGRPIFKGYVSFREGIYLYFVYLAFCCLYSLAVLVGSPHLVGTLNTNPSGLMLTSQLGLRRAQRRLVWVFTCFYQPNGLFLYEN